jgi:hypothetical protein
MKLIIYHGKTTPIKAVGVNQCRLLAFAYKYPGWHTFKNDRATVNAVSRLAQKGYLMLSIDQFKFIYP